jgi:hypothetical protein
MYRNVTQEDGQFSSRRDFKIRHYQESDLAFQVVLTPELKHSFGFDGPSEIIQ